ncbi:MAG: response regulator transcription factor [Elusimicrobia bacterium]|nr:response regulator transcription factor [Elusimicrobiota bacterium]
MIAMGTMGRTILVVEDDAAARHAVEMALSAAGHRVIATDSVASGWHLFSTECPDLAILDIQLPDGTGIELCERIRGHKERKATPVIILTSKGEFESKQTGFSAGADQYLVKPVPMKELALWAEALLKRLDYAAEDGDELKAGPCAIDLKSHIVRWNDVQISNLTGKEFDLLYFLVKKRPKVMSRKQILSQLWHTITVDHVVDTHLTNLRKKLPQELADKIQTLPGKGFRYLE